MRLPKSYKEISVEKYQELFPTLQKVLSEEDSDQKHEYQKELCKMLGYPIDHLNIGDQAKAVKQISFLKSNEYKLVYKHLWIKGSLYKAENDVEKLLTSQYVSIKTIIQDGEVIPHLHNLAPLCYKKLTWKGWKYSDDNHKELAEWFLRSNCHKVLPIVFFCSKVFNHWIQGTEVYSSSLKILKEREEEISRLMLDESFINTGLGTQQ